MDGIQESGHGGRLPHDSFLWRIKQSSYCARLAERLRHPSNGTRCYPQLYISAMKLLI
jgi:hypothetical protein